MKCDVVPAGEELTGEDFAELRRDLYTRDSCDQDCALRAMLFTFRHPTLSRFRACIDGGSMCARYTASVSESVFHRRAKLRLALRRPGP